MKLFFSIVVIAAVILSSASADELSTKDGRIEIGIDEQLGEYLPKDLRFTDESGQEILLKDLFDRPVVLAFVYYKCPGICSPLMSEIANVVDKVKLDPKKNYRVITISINPEENFKTAAEKKVNYLAMINGEFPEDSWTFLTGDNANIMAATEAAGFYFKKEGDEFIHSGALIFIDKNGKICRYLFPGYSDRSGYKILPFDFTMAVTETSEGKEIPTVAKMLQFCFSYDPEGRSYVLNLTRIFGAGILVLAIAFVLFLTIKPKKEKNLESRGK